MAHVYSAGPFPHTKKDEAVGVDTRSSIRNSVVLGRTSLIHCMQAFPVDAFKVCTSGDPLVGEWNDQDEFIFNLQSLTDQVLLKYQGRTLETFLQGFTSYLFKVHRTDTHMTVSHPSFKKTRPDLLNDLYVKSDPRKPAAKKVKSESEDVDETKAKTLDERVVDVENKNKILEFELYSLRLLVQNFLELHRQHHEILKSRGLIA